MTAGTEGVYDIIADANLDSYYQPWADGVVPIEVNPIVTGVESGTPVPVVNNLEHNFPNPFNPATTIRFSLATPGPATLRIYDSSGRLVRTLMDRALPRGDHEAQWNGLNDRGEEAASGVYFYRLIAPGFTSTERMVLVR